MQAEVALRFYLVEVHRARRGAFDLAQIRRRHQSAGGAGHRSGDDNPHRDDEPYRRALIGVYSRLAGTLENLTGGQAVRHAVAPGAAYANSWAFLADLVTIDESLRLHHSEVIAAQRLEPLDSRRGSVRLPPRHRRSAPKLRPSRGDDHGNSGAGAHRRRLRGAPRGGEAAAAAAAAVAIRAPCGCRTRNIREPSRTNWRSSPRRAAMRDSSMATSRSAITSSATPRRSAIFWKCCCCKRNAA